MSLPQYERVSVFREDMRHDTMDDAKLDKEILEPWDSNGSDRGAVERSPSRSTRQTYNYKPVILRTVPLMSLFVLTVILTGLLEFAAVELPHKGHNITTAPVQRRAGIESIVSAANSSIATSTASQTVSQSTLSATSSFSFTSAAGSTFELPSSLVTSYSGGPSGVANTAPSSAYLPPDDTQTVTLSPTVTSSSSAYTTTFSSATVFSVSVSDTTDGPSSTTFTSIQTSTSEPTTVLQTLTSTSAVSVPGSEQTVTQTSTSISGSQTVLHTLTSITSIPASVSDATHLYTSTVVSDGGLFYQTITTVSSTPFTSTPGPKYSAVTSYIAITSTVAPSSTSSPASKDSEDKTFTIAHHWDSKQTFLGTYFGVLVAVIYRILWTILYNNFTLIEPFRQLAHEDGALADMSFFAFYQAQSNLFGPIPAFAKKRWTLALAGTAYLVTSFLPAISSETLFVDTNYNCPFPDPKYPQNPCQARIVVSIPVLRVLQGLLAFAALAILVLLGVILSRPTGLPSNPAAAATVASLMRHPMLVADLNAIPTHAKVAEMQKALKGKHYQLGLYKTASGDEEYGIKPMHSLLSDSRSDIHHDYTPVEGSGWYADAANSRETARGWHYKDIMLAVGILGTFGVVLAYYLDGESDGFNNFFNSNTFGPRFILTGASTIVASLWRSVAHSQTITAPYTRLAQGPSAPSSTILFTPSNTPILSTWQALRARYFSTAFLTIVVLSAEALNIVISGVPYATGQLRLQLLVSVYLSFACLALMVMAAVLLIFFLRRREPHMPRRPDTLGSVMSYMSGSRMLDDFGSTEHETGSARQRRLQRLGKKYEFKETLRRDGKIGWTIDEVDHHGEFT